MNEEGRRFKYGQFGYGKYVYRREEMEDMKEFFYTLMEKYFPGAQSEYFI
jgi:spore photoproduct lyase